MHSNTKKNWKFWRNPKVKIVSCTQHVSSRVVETINSNLKFIRSILSKKIFFNFGFLRITNKKSQYSWFGHLFLFCGLWNWTTGQVISMEHPKTGWEVVWWWAMWLTNGGKRLVECGKTPFLTQFGKIFQISISQIRRCLVLLLQHLPYRFLL